MPKHRMILLICVLLTGFVSFSFGATTVEVGTCSSQYVQFSTIQSAVNSSPSGTIVLVCPGTYPEQVLLNKSITLKGFTLSNGNSGAIITVPAGGLVANATSLTSGLPIAAQILVQNTNKIVITNITVDGSNNLIASCSPNPIGIYFQNASGTVSHSAVLNEILGTGLEGCQAGLGIFVQSGNAGTSVVNVNNNIVQNYQKNGITGNEVGTSLTATSNTVVGEGPTTGAAENGIQIGFGATGTVGSNTTADDIWSPDNIGDPSDAAAGILVYASSGVSIKTNTVTNSQFGIAVVSDPTYGTADNSTINANKVNATHIFDAIDVCSNNNTVTANTLNSSDESGIHLDSSCGGAGNNNSVSSNVISVACAAILEGSGTSNPGVGVNTFYNVTNATLGADQCAAPLIRAKHSTPHYRPARP